MLKYLVLWLGGCESYTRTVLAYVKEILHLMSELDGHRICFCSTEKFLCSTERHEELLITYTFFTNYMEMPICIGIFVFAV